MSEAHCAQTHSIGSLAQRFGVSLRTLRFYEERGLLQPVHRCNQRYFTDKDVVRLQIILLAKRFGYTLQEISQIIDTRTLENAAFHGAGDLGLPKDEIEARIDVLTRQRDELDDAIETMRLSRSSAS